MKGRHGNLFGASISTSFLSCSRDKENISQTVLYYCFLFSEYKIASFGLDAEVTTCGDPQ
jgi:hypothetical protein